MEQPQMYGSWRQQRLLDVIQRALESRRQVFMTNPRRRRVAAAPLGGNGVPQGAGYPPAVDAPVPDGAAAAAPNPEAQREPAAEYAGAGEPIEAPAAAGLAEPGPQGPIPGAAAEQAGHQAAEELVGVEGDMPAPAEAAVGAIEAAEEPHDGPGEPDGGEHGLLAARAAAVEAALNAEAAGGAAFAGQLDPDDIFGAEGGAAEAGGGMNGGLQLYWEIPIVAQGEQGGPAAEQAAVAVPAQLQLGSVRSPIELLRHPFFDVLTWEPTAETEAAMAEMVHILGFPIPPDIWQMLVPPILQRCTLQSMRRMWAHVQRSAVVADALLHGAEDAEGVGGRASQYASFFARLVGRTQLQDMLDEGHLDAEGFEEMQSELARVAVYFGPGPWLEFAGLYSHKITPLRSRWDHYLDYVRVDEVLDESVGLPAVQPPFLTEEEEVELAAAAEVGGDALEAEGDLDGHAEAPDDGSGSEIDFEGRSDDSEEDEADQGGDVAADAFNGDAMGNDEQFPLLGAAGAIAPPEAGIDSDDEDDFGEAAAGGVQAGGGGGAAPFLGQANAVEEENDDLIEVQLGGHDGAPDGDDVGHHYRNPPDAMPGPHLGRGVVADIDAVEVHILLAAAGQQQSTLRAPYMFVLGRSLGVLVAKRPESEQYGLVDVLLGADTTGSDGLPTGGLGMQRDQQLVQVQSAAFQHSHTATVSTGASRARLQSVVRFNRHVPEDRRGHSQAVRHSPELFAPRIEMAYVGPRGVSRMGQSAEQLRLQAIHPQLPFPAGTPTVQSMATLIHQAGRRFHQSSFEAWALGEAAQKLGQGVGHRSDGRRAKMAADVLRVKLKSLPKARGVGNCDISVCPLRLGGAEIRLVLPSGGVERIFGHTEDVIGTESQVRVLKERGMRWNTRRSMSMLLIGTRFDRALQCLLIGVCCAINSVKEEHNWYGPMFVVQASRRTERTDHRLSARYAIVASDGGAGITRAGTHAETIGPGGVGPNVRSMAAGGDHQRRPGFFLCQLLSRVAKWAALAPSSLEPRCIPSQVKDDVLAVLRCSVCRILAVGGQNQAGILALRTMTGGPGLDPAGNGLHPLDALDSEKVVRSGKHGAGRDTQSLHTELRGSRFVTVARDAILVSMDFGFIGCAPEGFVALPSILGGRHAMALADGASAFVSDVPGFGHVGRHEARALPTDNENLHPMLLNPSLGTMQCRLVQSSTDSTALMQARDHREVVRRVAVATRDGESSQIRQLLPAILSVSSGFQAYSQGAFRSTRLSGDSHQRQGARVYGSLERIRRTMTPSGRQEAKQASADVLMDAEHIAIRQLQEIGRNTQSLRVEFSGTGAGLQMILSMITGLQIGMQARISELGDGSKTTRFEFLDVVSAVVGSSELSKVIGDISDATSGAMQQAQELLVQAFDSEHPDEGVCLRKAVGGQLVLLALDCSVTIAPSQPGQVVTKRLMDHCLPRTEAPLRAALHAVADGNLNELVRTISQRSLNWAQDVTAAAATVDLLANTISNGRIRHRMVPDQSVAYRNHVVEVAACLMVVGVQVSGTAACSGQRPLAVQRGEGIRAVVGLAAGAGDLRSQAVLDLRVFLESDAASMRERLGQLIGRMLHPAMVGAMLQNAPAPLICTAIRASPEHAAREVLALLNLSRELSVTMPDGQKSATLLAQPAALLQVLIDDFGVTLDQVLRAMTKVYEEVPIAVLPSVASVIRGGKNERFPPGVRSAIKLPMVPFPFALCAIGRLVDDSFLPAGLPRLGIPNAGALGETGPQSTPLQAIFGRRAATSLTSHILMVAIGTPRQQGRLVRDTAIDELGEHPGADAIEPRRVLKPPAILREG